MRINLAQGKSAAARVTVAIHNADTIQIPAGSPVVFNMNGTNNGLDVVLFSSITGANQQQGFRCGVVFNNVPVGGFDEAVVFGYTNYLLLIRQTRAASTAAWATEAARSIGEHLTATSIATAASIPNLTNGWTTTASTVQIVTNSQSTGAISQTILVCDAVLATTLASYASSASTTSDTRTAITAAVKAFVRVL
jgi:hypothetical protein